MANIIRLSGSQTQPVKMDAKDKKIMATLVDDARISLTQLAKKVGLKRETVDYRMKRLIQKGIITGFAPMVDLKLLGYSFFEIFIALKQMNGQRRKDLITKLSMMPSVKSVLEYNDQWDIKVSVISKNLEEFDKINNQIEHLFGSLILEKERCALLQSYSEDSISELFQPGVKVLNSLKKKNTSVKVDSTDIEILQELSKDCRQSTYQIADKVRLSADGVGLRMKKLTQNGVIIKYATWFDNSTLPLYWYTFASKLTSFTEETEGTINALVRNNSHIKSARKILGSWDIFFSVVAESHVEIHRDIKKIKESLAGSIKNSQTWLAYKEPYFTTLPKTISPN